MMKLFFLMAHSWAAAPGADPHAVPWTQISVQMFNFAVLLLVLGWFTRKAIRAHFETRARDYKMLVTRAEEAKREAERGRQKIKERLASLESNAEQGVMQARSEAEELKSRMIQEARDLSRKLEEDAKRTTQVALEKGKAELRRDLLQQALALSQADLKKNLSSNEQKELQNEFVEKIQVVSG